MVSCGSESNLLNVSFASSRPRCLFSLSSGLKCQRLVHSSNSARVREQPQFDGLIMSSSLDQFGWIDLALAGGRSLDGQDWGLPLCVGKGCQLTVMKCMRMPKSRASKHQVYCTRSPVKRCNLVTIEPRAVTKKPAIGAWSGHLKVGSEGIFSRD